MAGSMDETIKRLIRNEQAAYEELVAAYGEKLLRLAYLVTGDRQLAEDVVQETFFAVYRNIHNFRAESSFAAWITRIALNIAKNKIRPKIWRKIIFSREIDGTDNSALPQDEFEARERRRRVQETLHALPLKYRDVLYLYYFEEMKIKEIAEVLDLSESGVKTRLQRGREKMKTLLQAGKVGWDE
ncbi:MAG: sigma-70 family RNA polymerase sigma factor [Firmicutes bacterium]|nr:sigma-70 family RNA polymerase sigma factor [Bacillota bacterium]